jgi:hypothetical protein
LLLLLFQFFELLTDEVAVVLGVGIAGIELEGVFVILKGTLPGGDLLLGLRAEFTGFVEGVTEVVIGTGLEAEIGGEERGIEMAEGAFVILGAIGGGTGVEMEPGVIGAFLQEALEFLAGFVVSAGLVLAEGAGGGGRGGEGEQEEREESDGLAEAGVGICGGRGGGTRGFAAVGNEKLRDEEGDGNGEGPLEAFLKPPDEAGGDVGARQGREALFPECFHGACSAEGKIESIALGGNLAEEGFVEPGLDGVALGILEEFGRAIFVDGAEHFALRSADADGVDLQAGVRGLARGLDGAVIVVFAVGEQDEDLVVGGVLFEGSQGGGNGFRQGGAAERNDADSEGVEVLAEDLLVEGERALEEGGAGEGDEAEAVGAGEAGQVRAARSRDWTNSRMRRCRFLQARMRKAPNRSSSGRSQNNWGEPNLMAAASISSG